jgi:hypothetical protein
MDGARLLADALFLRDPFWVKHWRAVYGRRFAHSQLEVIAYEPEFMPLEDQTELYANRIRKLHQYQFLLRPAVSEGTISTDVFPINISTVTTDPVTGELHFPDRELMQELQSILAAKTGRPIRQLLHEQETALARYTQVVDGQLRRLPAIVVRPHQNGAPAVTRPEPKPPATASATSGSQTSSDVASATAPAGTQRRQITRRVRVS